MQALRSAGRLRHLAALVALAPLLPAVAACPAAAQIHPLPSGPVPLHGLVSEGAAAAVVEVDQAHPDRIRVRRIALLRGSLPERFAVKRAPSRGGGLGRGDRALLAFDGARPPFVIAGDPEPAILRPGPGEDPGAWTAAVTGLAEALADPVRLRDVYLGLVDGDLPSLRERALESLLARASPGSRQERPQVAPLSAEQARRRAKRALAADTPEDQRSAHARLAASRREGAQALLAGLVASPGAAALLPLAIGAGRAHHLPEATRTALLRALADPRPPVRSAAVRAARLAPDPPVLDALQRAAEADPDPRVRERAARLLARHPRAGGARPPAPSGRVPAH